MIPHCLRKRGLKSCIMVSSIVLIGTGSVLAEDFPSAMLSLLLISSPATCDSAGQVWMDRNLGASRVATSFDDAEAYGDLYQWGRGTDGHEKRTSATTEALSSGDVPGHGQFIMADNGNYDWRDPQNDNLWQGLTGINNPCPSGFRLPTDAELDIERLSWGSNDSAGAYASPLKLVVAGYRFDGNGSINSAGSDGGYWSSTLDGTRSRNMSYFTVGAEMRSGSRAFGFSVRCIKD